jgi:hypothetical protein
MLNLPEDPGVVLACACHDSAAVFSRGEKEFVGQFDGSIATTVGAPRADAEGGQVVPLNIVGYSTQSAVPEFGRVSLDFDYTRPVPPSTVRGEGEEFFPAVQTMDLQILMTSDAFPGVTLRSRERGTLVNAKVKSFPPDPGATYTLQKPVDLIHPGTGEVAVRLLSVNTSIVSTRLGPEKLVVGSGVVLQLDEGRSLVEGREIRVSLPRGGVLAVRLYDPEGRTVRETEGRRVEAGTHSVPLDSSGMGDRFAWQLLLNGEEISGRMPVAARRS